jgi:hypothetical protein
MSMKQGTDHLIHEGLTGRVATKEGKGLFATQDFQKGEMMIVFGGRAVMRTTLDGQSRSLGRHALQIGKEIFLQGSADEEGEWVNHSCDPNLGVQGQITLVAMRDIKAGEEVCFDYAMVDMSDADEFNCQCGSQNCRGRVTGEDWRLPELQNRYKGYFGAHVQRAINESLKK